jgi:hypothetical protein
VPAGLVATEPTGMMQTLVCADSRCDGVPDLYDKEMAVLIGEVVARGAHMVTILDSCHSDGADREIGGGVGAGAAWFGEVDEAEHRGFSRLSARWVPAADSAPSASALVTEVGGVRSAAVQRENPNYVALAACRRDQTAQEIRLPYGHRGAFSLAILNQLERQGPDATYRELMTGARCYVENLVSRQTPVLFPISEPIVDQKFLGGAARLPRSSMSMRCVRGVWEIDAGACHGMVAGPPDDRTRVGVHGSGTEGTDRQEAELIRVHPTKSVVRPLGGWEPDARWQYPVVVTRVPLPPATVAIAAAPDTDDTVALLVEAMRTAGPHGDASPHIRLAPPEPDAHHRTPDLLLDLPQPHVARILGADGGALVTGVSLVTDAAAAEQVVADLEHIARWRAIKALENPSSHIAGAIHIELRGADHLDTDQTGCVALEYTWDGLQWVPPEVFVALRNTSDRTLYCVLLDMTDRFRSHVGLFPGDLVASSHTAWAGGGSPIVFELPDGEEPVPGARITDWLKVLVAEEPFTAAPYVLPQLGGGAPGPVARDGTAAASPAVDWTTAIVPVITRVPGPAG